MGSPMKIRARLNGDTVDVKVLMGHPMETGMRKTAAGEPIPAHFIQTVTASLGERVVLSAQWGTAVSANPYLAFRFKGGASGERLKVTWTDNTGDSRSDEATIA